MILFRVLSAGLYALVFCMSSYANGTAARFLSANDARHFAWHNNNTVSEGVSNQHYSKQKPYPFVINEFSLTAETIKIADLFSISSNDRMTFAWFILRSGKGHPSETVSNQLFVCTGPSRLKFFPPLKLGFEPTGQNWYTSTLPSSLTSIHDLLFITSNDDRHFAWFRKGNELWVGKGPSNNLGKEVSRAYLPAGVLIDDIWFMASNDNMHFVFLNDGTYTAGSIEDLGDIRYREPYDIGRLGYYRIYENYDDIVSEVMEFGIDRPGMDIPDRHFNLEQAHPAQCQKACRAEVRCKAWTYVKPGETSQSIWAKKGRARCWLKEGVPTAKSHSCCVSGVKGKEFKAEYNTDRAGLDYRHFDLATADPVLCQMSCDAEVECKAWTYVKPGIRSPKAWCWLKNNVPLPKSNSCCISGVK